MRPPKGPALIVFEVDGQPAGAGSKTAEPLGKRGKEVRDRTGRIVLKYRPASKFTAPWMKKVMEAAKDAWPGSGAVGTPLWLDVDFYEERPLRHYFHRKAGDVLRPDAPAHPHQTETHDVDKMRRAISDSLTEAELIVDDKRIVGGEAWKHYADDGKGPRAAITIGRMADLTVEEAGIIQPPAAGQEALT